MNDLTPQQLEAGMAALHQCTSESRPANFTVTLIYRAIQEAALAHVVVIPVGAGGGPPDSGPPSESQG